MMAKKFVYLFLLCYIVRRATQKILKHPNSKANAKNNGPFNQTELCS